MAVELKQPFISPDEYWEIEQASETRSEYISGEMFAMASPSRAHGDIVVNVGGELRSHLSGKPCRANAGLSVAAPGSFLVPDVVVYCEGAAFVRDNNVLQDPIVIVEVLSPSTSGRDRGEKWFRYQNIPSLMHYVLIYQDEPRIEVFSRNDGIWIYEDYDKLEGDFELTHIDCRLRLSDIYDGVAFEPSPSL